MNPTKYSSVVAVDGVVEHEVSDYSLGRGDRLANVIGKIPGIKKLPCYDEAGQLKPESGCGKMVANLNDGMPFTDALRQRLKPNQETNTMTRINATITASDDNNLIFETRGGRPQMKVIPRDKDAAKSLFAAVEDALKANERPERVQAVTPATATPAKTPK